MYLVVSQFGLALSVLSVIGTLAVGYNAQYPNDFYSQLVLYMFVAGVMSCLVAMKYRMNVRQLECDTRAATPVAGNSAAIGTREQLVQQ